MLEELNLKFRCKSSGDHNSMVKEQATEIHITDNEKYANIKQQLHVRA